jgi:hypothetical protein
VRRTEGIGSVERPASNEMVGRLRTIMREPVESPARNSPFVFVSSVSPCSNQLGQIARSLQESRTRIALSDDVSGARGRLEQEEMEATWTRT